MVKTFNYCLFEGKKLSLLQRKAVLTLIPKKGDLLNSANWRPISLLNTDYKILTKVIANRLSQVLTDLTDPHQACSVQGRKIQDHLLMIREIISYTRNKKSPTYIISIDQEKAFDKVNWQFMFDALRAHGLPEKFVEMVRILYTDIESTVQLNGYLTD